MQKLKMGLGLMMLLGLASAGASAQEVPEETRKEIARNLEGPFVVLREDVQDELELTDAQREAVGDHLRERIQDFGQFFDSLQGLDRAEHEKKIQAFRKKAQNELASVLKGTLKEDQVKRLRQLELQQAGALALFHGRPELAKDLKITTDQRKQFMKIVQDMQKRIEPLIKESQSGGDPEEIRPKVFKIRKEHEDKIVAVLTDEQKTQWNEMIGKPFAMNN
jgi:hypothetical protein